MIRAIDTLACTGCTLCEKVCPVDLFRLADGRMTLAYPGDCCNCLQICLPGGRDLLHPRGAGKARYER